MIFPYKLSGAMTPNFYNHENNAQEITLSICSSGEKPRDHTLFSTIAISFENVNIGSLFFFANGLIFRRISLVNGPITNLGFSFSNKLIIIFSLIKNSSCIKINYFYTIIDQSLKCLSQEPFLFCFQNLNTFVNGRKTKMFCGF